MEPAEEKNYFMYTNYAGEEEKTNKTLTEKGAIGF